MKRLVEFQLQDGQSIFAEIEDSLGEQLVPAATPGEIIVKATRSFETALDSIRPIAEVVISKVRGLVDKPEEVKVEFGLKLSARAGAVLASADAEGNFKIELTWKKEKNG